MSADQEQYEIVDEIVAAVAIDNRVATHMIEIETRGIERTGHLTRGQLVVDWNRPNKDQDQRTIRIVKCIDRQLLEQMLKDSLSVTS